MKAVGVLPDKRDYISALRILPQACDIRLHHPSIAA